MQKTTHHKKKLGGYPATGVVISTTLALFVVGLFGLLLIYSQQLEKQVRQNIRMQVYLKSGLSETQRLEIKNKLLALDYVTREEGSGLTFVSKEDAAKKFIAETGEDFTSFLGENPLRDAYLVGIDARYHSREQMESIKTEIQKINGVYQVFYVEGLIEAVNENVTKIALVLAGLIVILLITVALLINNRSSVGCVFEAPVDGKALPFRSRASASVQEVIPGLYVCPGSTCTSLSNVVRRDRCVKTHPTRRGHLRTRRNTRTRRRCS